jgi:PAS domain S-box-containing protein
MTGESPRRVPRLGRARAIERLLRQNELILNAVAEGIYGVDVDGRVTFANPAAERMLGWPVADLLGQDVHELVHHSRPDGARYPGEECPTNAALLDGRVHVVEDDIFWRKDGTPLPVEYTTTPMSEDGGLIGAVITFRDLTERHAAGQLQGEVRRLAEQQAEQNEQVAHLHDALLPTVPAVDELDVGVHYLPAEPNMPTGGDMYDLLVLPDGDLHLAVVDVMGKGVRAAHGALTVIHALRFLVAEGCDTGDLGRQVSQLLEVLEPELVATILVGRYTPTEGRLVLAGAGHPPALLVSASGDVREVAASGVALGWPGAGSGEVVEVTLGRSETVVLYTDGLIEANKDVLSGLASLRAAASETAGYPARHLARTLVQRALSDAVRHDDSLALVLRRRLPLPLSGDRRLGPFEYRFTPSPTAVPLARHLFTDWLSYQPVDDQASDDLLLVVSELCTNAVHAASGKQGGVVFRAWDDADALVIEVEDDGAGFEEDVRSDDEQPDPYAPGGRGLYLVQALADSIDVTRRDGHTIVRCVTRTVLPSD